MVEKISVKRKNLSDIDNLFLSRRVKLLSNDYNNNNNFVAVIDVNLQFVFANNSLLDIFQYSIQDLKDRKLSDLFRSINKSNELNKILNHIEKTKWSGEVVCFKKDKTSFSSNLKIIPIIDNNDSLCGYEIIAANVSGTKPNYKNLFEFLLRLEKSYNSFPELLIILDENRYITKFKYFDIESDYFVLNPENYTKLEDLFPQHIVSEIDLAINKIKSGIKSILLEFQLTILDKEKVFEARITRVKKHQYSINLKDKTKNQIDESVSKNTSEKLDQTTENDPGLIGKKIFNRQSSKEFNQAFDSKYLSVAEMYSPVIDDNKVIGFIAIEGNKIETTQSEKKVIISDNKLKSIWEKSFDGMRLTDSKGNIVAVNSAFCKMFGMEESSLLGKPFTVIYKQNQNDNERQMNKYRRNYLEKNFELQRYSKSVLHNSKSLFLFVNYSLIEILNGESLVLGIFRDITDLRKAQDELSRAETLAAIGKMSTYLTHEIKNPIASIKNYVDVLLNNREMPENTKPVLNILRDSLGNLSKLLSDVLIFSSNIKLIKIEINIYDLVEKVRELLEHKISQKNIKFINSLGINVIRGDYVSLQSVFFNVIDNAIDAVSNGGTIELKDSVDSKNYLIQIIDNGCGITEPDKIFEAFHTLKKGGTGLGLAIAKKIMELHDGNISLIKSEPGRTIFELQFPSNGIG